MIPHVLFALVMATVQGGGTVIGYFDRQDQCWQQAGTVLANTNKLTTAAFCVAVNYKR